MAQGVLILVISDENREIVKVTNDLMAIFTMLCAQLLLPFYEQCPEVKCVTNMLAKNSFPVKQQLWLCQ